jgi:glycosyltransferase involved in cell wall biosynthesis
MAEHVSMVEEEERIAELVAAVNSDAIYFLMFEGWEQELRSNRWHYAKRWARHLPVTLMQPIQVVASTSPVVCDEARIGNCRILSIKSSWSEWSYRRDSLVQLEQVTRDMEALCVRRPLLWLYNPNLVGLYAALPAVGRVLHATENYFHFDGAPGWFLARHKLAIQISDTVVAVSDGVATSIRENVPDAPVTVVSNGCDYKEYSRFVPDEQLLDTRRAGQRIVIYAGNINSRLDYALIQRCVTELRHALFVFFGPVMGLSGDDARRWAALTHEPNVRYFGPADPDRLAGLYGAADVGVIPYKQTRMLVENGFPLKALEMCATGLPVVSTLMKPIEGLMDGLVVARDHDSFVARLAQTSRSSLTGPQLDDMRAVCQQHDYDVKFRAVLDLIETRLGRQCEPATRWEAVLSQPLVARVRALTEQLTARMRNRFAKGLLTVRLLMTHRILRRMLWEYLKDGQIRRHVRLPDVLADLLRLGILRDRTKSSANGFEIEVRYEPAKATLLCVSVMALPAQGRRPSMGESPLPKVGPVERIVWDHSGVAHSVLWARRRGADLSVHLGPQGIYEFEAIRALTRRPAVGRALVTAVLGQDRGEMRGAR